MFDRTALINWLLLMGLVLLWGTSFMFISISVESLHPLTIVFSRVLIGALILTLVVYAKGLRLPHTISAWLAFIAMGIVGNVLPFFLISWGQLSVNSGIAGMIMATMPLITMILAHYLVDGEDLNRYKIMGFTFGIGGIAVLLGPVFDGGGQAAYGGIAIFIAASSYAVNSILVRRLPKFNPFISTSGVLIAATVVVFPIWWFVVPASNGDISTLALSSTIWLGIGPTAIATLMLFAVIDRAGPTFLSTINYMIPVVAFFTGAYVLSEPVESSSIVALVIILSGIAMTRFRINQ
ncbi:MAG: drug/metabolite transporter (DMT)-like permease [Candidatus Azotimanducaceae bacterium]|jgi:drug/metabolite transporter (DMT)-like permease